jgi:hypothetical protein
LRWALGAIAYLGLARVRRRLPFVVAAGDGQEQGGRYNGKQERRRRGQLHCDPLYGANVSGWCLNRRAGPELCAA